MTAPKHRITHGGWSFSDDPTQARGKHRAPIGRHRRDIGRYAK